MHTYSVNSDISPEKKMGKMKTIVGKLQKKKVMKSKAMSMIMDAAIVSGVFMFVYVLEGGLIPQFKNLGFYCNDPHISHKYTGDTVTMPVLMAITFIPTYFAFLLTEWLIFLTKKGEEKVVSSWRKTAHKWYLIFFMGSWLVFVFTDIAKLIVGEPRPHFLQTCQPLEARNCTTGEYIAEYTCSNNVSKSKLDDAHRSFFSGHSSVSTYTSIFFMYYFHERIRTDSYTLVYFLQTCSFSWAAVVCITRVTDFRHHWWDVLAGSLLGIIGAVYFIIESANYFEKTKIKKYRASGTMEEKYI